MHDSGNHTDSQRITCTRPVDKALVIQAQEIKATIHTIATRDRGRLSYVYWVFTTTLEFFDTTTVP